MVTNGSNGCSPARATWFGAAVTALVAAFAFHGEAQAQAQFASTAGSARAVTYASDVANIINNNCVVCHREGGIGPMELTNYDQVRPWAPVIRDRVVHREMPPYAYDTDVGVQKLKDDWRLSQEDINTIASWVDQGAPMGNPDDLPPPPDLLDPSEWSFTGVFGRPPDLVIRSTPIDVPAIGNDMWHRPIVPTGITEERCIQATQVKPAGNAKTVVHHAIPTFQATMPDGSVQRMRATEYAMGKIGEIIPDGVCRVAPPNSELSWDIHLFPGGLGKVAPGTIIPNNVVELGIWFQPEDYQYQYKQDLSLYGFEEGQTEMVIPPNGKVMTQGYLTFDHPVRIDSWQPHGHLRLRAASLEVLYPGDRDPTVISMISNWSATWHQSHIYADDVAPLVPAGAVIIQKQWYDNTADNPNNPDPDQWVNYGSRTADEMSHGWMAITHLDEEGYQQLVEEREAAQRVTTEP